jgi:probable rRNA maturation factor
MVEINNKTRSKVDLILVRKVAEKFLKLNRKQNYNISIAFVGDGVIRKLNKVYRGKDKVTDVLAFTDVSTTTRNVTDGIGDGEKKFLGEIIINYTQIKRQAKQYGNSVKEELIFVLVHGLLHLLGYDDETRKERRKMERLSKEFIGKIKYKE